MSMKIRWFRMKSLDRRCIAALAGKMLVDSFKPERSWGFTTHTSSADYIRGTFIEKLEIKQIIDNPIGAPIVYSRTEFRQTRFRLSTRPYNLEISNSPRSATAFFNQLCTYLNYDAEIHSPTVECLEWVKGIEKSIGRIKVTDIRLINIPLSTSAKGDFRISGVDDVRPLIKDAAGGRAYQIQSLKFVSQRLVGNLSQNGRVNLESECSATDIGLLREALLAAEGN